MTEPTEERLTRPVDLTNCDREPIHIPGRIQSFGTLIAVSHDWMITHTSENAGATLGSGLID